MSRVCCAWCEDHFYTKSGEGWFEPDSPFRYKCDSCIDRDRQLVDIRGNLVHYDDKGNERKTAA